MEATPQPKAGKGGMYVGIGIAVVALIVSVVAIAWPAPTALQVPAPAPTTRTFRIVSDLLNLSNRWYPSSLTAFTGDTLVFNVTNKGAIPHGFTVEGLGIQDVLNPGQSKEFTSANVAAGLYRYYCQLHAGHIGGQLLVLGR